MNKEEWPEKLEDISSDIEDIRREALAQRGSKDIEIAQRLDAAWHEIHYALCAASEEQP